MNKVFYKALRGVVLFAGMMAIILLVISTLAMVGCGSGAIAPEGAAESSQPSELNDVPQVAAGSISEDLLGETVRISGEVVKQCPAVGCWFIVKDESGEVFVDLNPAGLRLTEKHEGEQTEVVGRVIKQGGEFKLAAQAIEFGIASEMAEKNKP